MRHERLGILPRRKNWQSIVDDIRLALDGDLSETAILISNTLDKVSDRYKKIFNDSGVQAAFAYLVALSTKDLPLETGLTSVEINLDKNPSIFRITADLSSWVDAHASSNEYAELACRAAADTITKWSRQKSIQQNLFDDSSNANNVWSGIDGRGFCDIARTFFAKFTERYIKYFIERSASAETKSLHDRERFENVLSEHIESISQHAFETSKITQSFSTGWFNKTAKSHRPTNDEISGFLAVAFGKLHEELSREGVS